MTTMAGPIGAPKLIAAFGVAAFVSVYAAPVLFCTATMIGASQGSCSAALRGYSWFGLPLAAIAILLAVPCFLLFLKRGWIRWWQVSLAGAAIGLVVAIALHLIDPNVSWYGLATLSTPLGFLGGITFWLIAAMPKMRASSAPTGGD